MSALSIRFHQGGVYLPHLRLWLDPHEPKTGPDRVFVSHAHSDHIGLHREVILSPPTSKLMHARLEGTWQEHVVPYGKALEFTDGEVPFRITLLPAGHIFGSAMSLIEAGTTSLLYTGDFKLRPGRSAERCEPRPADILITETTYGRAIYQFPPSAEVLKGVVRFCREALDNEETPVLLGYSLGKSQELLCGLGEAGLPLMLHGTVYRLTKIYEQFGQCFPAYERYESGRARGKVLVCPPNVINSAMLRHLKPTRIAVLTGWAVDANCRYRYQADAAFPLSDHADFPELLELVERVKPKQVYTLHGFAADFAHTLRERGVSAQALSEDEQLALPLLLPTVSSAALTQAPAVSPREDSQTRETECLHDAPPRNASTNSTRPANSFETFAQTCARIGSTAKKLEKTAILANYLRGLDPEEVRLVSIWFTGHPFASTDNKVLQLGWALIRDVLCAVAKVDQNEFGRTYLKHSDLGETAYEMLSARPQSAGRVALPDVQAAFERLHAARGPTGKFPILAEVVRQSSALETKYLVKILTGELRIGLKEGLVEEALAQAFEVPLDELKSVNLMLGNVGETAELAKRKELHSAALVPYRPLKFMLASPEETATDIWQRVTEWHSVQSTEVRGMEPLPLGVIPTSPNVWVEDKYDGIRSQVHKVGTRVALYSRDLKEITTTFLDVADRFAAIPDDFILDGELIAMTADEVLPFSELQKRLGRREGDLFLGQQIPVQFIAFDLLWRNGESMLQKPLRDRRAELEELSSLLHLAQVTRVQSAAEVEAAFVAARERGNEGLMIKDPNSTYAPGRRGLAWLKLKKAYATLDCVVVGAEYGHGKRKAVLSDYTFAVLDETSGRFKVIGKAYSGLTDAEIATLTQHFLDKALRQHGRYFEVEPDTVLEVAFDAVQVSDRHDSGLALRFPRIARIRSDKTPQQIDTLATARKLVRTSGRARKGKET